MGGAEALARFGVVVLVEVDVVVPVHIVSKWKLFSPDGAHALLVFGKDRDDPVGKGACHLI